MNPYKRTKPYHTRQSAQKAAEWRRPFVEPKRIVSLGWGPGNPDYEAVKRHILSQHGIVYPATGRISIG